MTEGDKDLGIAAEIDFLAEASFAGFVDGGAGLVSGRDDEVAGRADALVLGVGIACSFGGAGYFVHGHAAKINVGEQLPVCSATTAHHRDRLRVFG